MSAIKNLRALATGERPVDALLPPVRLFAGGTEYFGEEAILHAFRRDPLTLSTTAEVVETEGHVAIVDRDAALFAALHGDRIARIWRLGPGEPGEAEPAIGVPFDTDLRQARCDVAFRPEDHPALGPQGAEAVKAIGRDLAHGWDAAEDQVSAYRRRPFAIQAFDDGDHGAVLFAFHQLGPDAVRSSGFAFAAATFRMGSDRRAARHIVRDAAGEAAIARRPWRTHFG